MCLSWRNQDIWPNENTFTKHSLKGIYWRTAIKSFRWIYSNLIMERGQSHGWGSNSDWNHPRHEIFAKIWFKFALLWNQATNIMPFIQKGNLQTSIFYEYVIMSLRSWILQKYWIATCLIKLGCCQNYWKSAADTLVYEIFVTKWIKSSALWP